MASHQSWQWTAGAAGLWISPVLLWGCTSPVSPLAAAQGAAAAVATPDQTNYLLGPEDAIEISAWKEPELTKQLVVRPDGKISHVTAKVNRPVDCVIGKPGNAIPAISKAGGRPPCASPGAIAVLRTVAGKAEAFPFHAEDVSKGQFLEPDRTVLPENVA
jgi:polysaccharide biosynthesis/export protein